MVIFYKPLDQEEGCSLSAALCSPATVQELQAGSPWRGMLCLFHNKKSFQFQFRHTEIFCYTWEIVLKQRKPWLAGQSRSLNEFVISFYTQMWQNEHRILSHCTDTLNTCKYSMQVGIFFLYFFLIPLNVPFSTDVTNDISETRWNSQSRGIRMQRVNPFPAAGLWTISHDRLTSLLAVGWMNLW